MYDFLGEHAIKSFLQFQHKHEHTNYNILDTFVSYKQRKKFQFLIHLEQGITFDGI